MVEVNLLWTIGTGIFAGGAAYGGVKAALNGTRARVIALEDVSKVAASSQNEMRERMVRVETKLDNIAHKLDKM